MQISEDASSPSIPVIESDLYNFSLSQPITTVSMADITTIATTSQEATCSGDVVGSPISS
jgi:hypothetical protein